ncbi:MAG: ribose 5-phosphate isomerase B [Dehalococcoidia bacterium]
MILAFGADHAGFPLKEYLIETAKTLGHEVLDFGTYSLESVDYPDYAVEVSEAVLDGRAALGVLVCSNGVGISITANKVPGIRCALCHTSWGAARSRQHANANVLALGGWETGIGVAGDILRAFLESEFEGGRHERRVGKMMDVEARGIAEQATRA